MNGGAVLCHDRQHEAVALSSTKAVKIVMGSGLKNDTWNRTCVHQLELKLNIEKPTLRVDVQDKTKLVLNIIDKIKRKRISHSG